MTAAFLLFLSTAASLQPALAGQFVFCESELTGHEALTATSEFVHLLKIYIEKSGNSNQKVELVLQRLIESEVPTNPIFSASNSRDVQLRLAFETTIRKLTPSHWLEIKRDLTKILDVSRKNGIDRERKVEETAVISDFRALHQSENNLSSGQTSQITVGTTSYVVVAARGKTSLFVVDLLTGKVTDKNWLSSQVSINSIFDLFKTDDDHIYVSIGGNTELRLYKIESVRGLVLQQTIDLPQYIRSVQVLPLPQNRFAALVSLEKGLMMLHFDSKTEKFVSADHATGWRWIFGGFDSLGAMPRLFKKQNRSFFVAQRTNTSAILFEIDPNLKIIEHPSLPIHFKSDRELWFNIQRHPVSFEANGETYLALTVHSEVGTPGITQLRIFRLVEKKMRNRIGWPVQRIVAEPVSQLDYKWGRYNQLTKIEKNGRIYFVTTTDRSFEMSEFNPQTNTLRNVGSQPLTFEPKNLNFHVNEDGRAYMVGYVGDAIEFYELRLESGDFIFLDRHKDIDAKAENAPLFIKGVVGDFVAHVNTKLEILATTKKIKQNRQPQGEEEKECEALLTAPALSYISMVEIYFATQGAKAKDSILSSIMSSKQILNPFSSFKSVAETQIGQALDRMIARVSESDWIAIQKGLAPLSKRLIDEKEIREEKSEKTQNILDVTVTYNEPGPIPNSTPSTYVTTHGRTFVSYSTFEDKKIHLYELNLATGALENHESYLTNSSEQHGPTFFKLANDDAFLALGTGDNKILLFAVGNSPKTQLQLTETVPLERIPHVFMPLRLNDGRQLLLVDSFDKDEPKDRQLVVFEILRGKLVRRGAVAHHIQLTGKAGLLVSQSTGIEIVIAGGGKWQRFDLDTKTLDPTFNKTISTHAFEFGVPKRFRTSQDQAELTYFATKNGLTIGWPSESGIADPVLVDPIKLGDAAAAVLNQIDGRDIFVLRGSESLTITELMPGKKAQRLAHTNINDCYRYIGSFVSPENRIIITCTDLHKLKIFTFDPATNTLELSQQLKAAYDQTPFFVVEGEQAYMITQNHDTKTRQVFRFYRPLDKK